MNRRKYFIGIVATVVFSFADNPVTVSAQDSTKKLILTHAITAALNKNKASNYQNWMMGVYFTATSMIGFIAIAGVLVRNSVLLINFINIRLRENIPLKHSIIEAGVVRTIPILFTAGVLA